MELALNEIKTQAKKLLKIIRESNDLPRKIQLALKKLTLSPDEIKLKHSLTIVSQQLGFENWHHAQDILSGNDKTIETRNMGDFFYPKGCGGFINEWFANYQQAKETLSEQPETKWLLPYRKQFIVVKKDYIDVFRLNEKLLPLWAEIEHDMVNGYNSSAWDKLTCEIIKNRPKDY